MLLDRPNIWRYFVTSESVQALTIGLLAAILATAIWPIAPATFTALDWTIYDTWLRHREPISVSPSITVVIREPLSEDQFGAILDRSILAQLITVAHEAGATVIGIDQHLGHAGPASLGGATSEALFMEAVNTAGPLVFVHQNESALHSDGVLTGHVIVSTQADHVTRQIPLLTTVEAQTIPAFGSILYDFHRQQTTPTAQPLATESSAMLVNFVGNGSLAALPTTLLSSVWEALQHHDKQQLDGWFNGKVVLILSNQQTQGPWLLPTGQSVTGVTAHIHLLNSLLTDNRICAMGRFGGFVLTFVMASCIAWSLLRLRGAVSLLAAGGILASYVALSAALLPGMHLVLPLAVPVMAALFVIVGTTAWTHLTAGPRMLLLEQEMLLVHQDAAAVREALILRENRAEALEEDLETAKAAVAHSTAQQQELTQRTAALQAQIDEAQVQEQAARRQLAQLERQLHDLQAANITASTVGDAELDHLKRESRGLGIVTEDATLLRMFRDVKRGAPSPLTVLLLGEPGTGKELFARALHRLSPRANKTFIAVNMAAISPELFESELFGHMKGSFTGASTDRRGYFELAHQGTIFLDEIGDLRFDHQSKLLRVLQEKSFYRVGATVPTTVDVRVVAATNRDLQRGVSESWFREDLYFRLKGLVFRLPPLRERAADIPVIAEAVLSDIAKEMGRPVPRLSNDAVQLLSEYAWPGNVRELRHALERAVALSDGLLLTKTSFVIEGVSHEDKARTKTASLPDSASDSAMLDCLRQHGFDMQATAKSIGWDRSTVTQRLKGLCFQALVESNGNSVKAATAIAGDPAHVRTVELKLSEYYKHLMSVIEPYRSADEALTDCRRRFKNLPERHFASVASLIKQHFQSMDGTPKAR
jgi:transcriptional regulator with PAS, ATPase and Fis domain